MKIFKAAESFVKLLLDDQLLHVMHHTRTISFEEGDAMETLYRAARREADRRQLQWT